MHRHLHRILSMEGVVVIKNAFVLTDAPAPMAKVLSLFLPDFGIHQQKARVRGISVPTCERP